MLKGDRMKNLIYSLLILTFTLPLIAQTELGTMSVESKPYIDESAIVARKLPDGRPCAGVQILSDLDGFSYDSYLGVVGGIVDNPGSDIVYLDPQERVLLAYHVGYEPLKIVFSEMGVQLKEKQMWVIKIKGGVVDMLPVSFVIEPRDAEIIIDGKNMGTGPTFKLLTGKHEIQINRSGYQTTKTTITVNPNQVLFNYQLVFQNEMVLIKGGSFDMGDTFGEGDSDEKPVHRVTVNSFYLSQYELTFSEYNTFCMATGRKHHSDYGMGAGLRPMTFVSWYDAVEYCNWRSTQEGLTPCYTIDQRRKDPNNHNKDDSLKWTVTCNFNANGYRLPTEAEWEYAARESGRKVRFGNGKDIADPEEINFCGLDYQDYKQPYSKVGVYRAKTTDVGSFAPNALKLYDMSGNVWEWCWDWYGGNYYQNSPAKDPRGPMSGKYRVLRGGSWFNGPIYVRAANRVGNYTTVRRNYIGFRCARTF